MTRGPTEVKVNEFPHAMLREIYEQPDAIRRTLDLYLDGQTFDAQAFAPLAKWLNPRGEVLIAASGSSRTIRGWPSAVQVSSVTPPSGRPGKLRCQAPSRSWW